MKDTLIERCEAGVAALLRLGATDAEIYGQSARTMSATIEKHDLQMARMQEETAFGIRALVGDRIGFASTNDIEDLQRACREAVTLAKASPGDPHNALPEGTPVVPVEKLYDPESERFTADRVVERAIEMLCIAEAIDRRVILGDGEFVAKRGERAVANSRGVAAAERSSLFLYSALATAKDGDRVSNMDYQFGATRSVAGIDVEPIVRRASRNALDSLGAEPGRSSFRGPVLLSPQAVEPLLIALLLYQTNARNVLRRQSRWGDAVGHRVAAPALTVVDDGRLPGGVATSAFDREGVPHAPITVIEQGTLAVLLHNSYSARALAQPNTAHAAGSAQSVPGIGPTNLTILPGTASKESLLSEMRRGLLVTRFSGNLDPVSGDFSGVAKGAHLVENGRVTHAVSGTLIAGNAFECLENLSGISCEQEAVLNLTLPYVRVEGVSVTGR
ncbi:MAG: TldD/PmbA family protein [Candidatus Bipolaricaulis sp.]|nr:TldD/PmbA family protein [Candidatus Bipolaricaulis sp.]MDD5219279.1 TldD/PmbA family protein [Candidatus Bipolaricaulis sp.]MDD5647214.1 TldD/PmbA family protein [Candidatus Bipolaricaulis sp.]